MVGERLRQARVSRQLSLAEVARQAEISAATLSRVERDKQAIDVDLLVRLAQALSATPAELLVPNADGAGDAALVARIVAMQTRERTKLWRELREARRARRAATRSGLRTLALELEELLAQMDFLREEIEAMGVRLGNP